jgi:hypothetical protein
MKAGDTFRWADRALEKHLWIVISDPLLDVADDVAIVRLTTRRKDSDCTCILQPGDHPFITHETVVDYGCALDISNAGLEGFVGNGKAFLRERVSAEVLDRIRQGAAESGDMPEGCKEILIRQGLINP